MIHVEIRAGLGLVLVGSHIARALSQTMFFHSYPNLAIILIGSCALPHLLQVVDFEQLAFNQGGHFRSNKSINLPEGSERISKKGYDLVMVPALKPKPFAQNEKLVQISELPDWAQQAFEGMKELNRVQSRVSETALYSSENMLVCAPTGAGKTNVAMLTIMHQIGMHR